MTKSKCVKCHAKINLSLDVIGKRPDGYHDLEMLMQEIELHDLLEITADTSSSCRSVEIFCDKAEIPNNGDNLAAIAAEKFMDTAEISASVKIRLQKNTPSGAGLGGGSSDAAGVLSAMNDMFEKPLSDKRLSEIASEIGSDVPFFLLGGCCLATGTGTTLEAVPSLRGAHILLAKPDFPVSTPHVYKSLKLNEATKHPNTQGVLKALADGDLSALAANTGNVLESVTAAEHGEIEQYKAIMLKHGAVYSLMSGSGPTVFGIFTDQKNAENAAKVLETLTSEVFVTEPHSCTL